MLTETDAPLPSTTLPPLERYLSELHERLSRLSDGRVADYIPELSKADPRWFGIAIATVDGKTFAAGDTGVPFTIQSVSKPFAYGYALREHGTAAVLRKVGVEPTGEAFNSIVLDEVHNRPFNPMVNAGAIAVAELYKGASPEERRSEMMRVFAQFAGRKLDLDETVYRSEDETGHRNRAIAYMMLNSGMIERDPRDVLDLYFRQCSIRVTALDLALMAATLANDGVQPITGEPVLGVDEVRDVLTVMSSCGMYNYAGQWAFEVGIPAKSGVSGAIVGVIPGQIGIGIFSPPLDEYGNSVRGVTACKEISRAFGLHVFNNRPNAGAVIRRDRRGDTVRSTRLRTAEERAVLEREGRRTAILELQGTLFFGAAERITRRVGELAAEAAFVVLDFRLVRAADRAASRLLELMVADPVPGLRLMLTHLEPDGPLRALRRSLTAAVQSPDVVFAEDTDIALEWCETALLRAGAVDATAARWSLASLDVFEGLGREELRLLEGIVQTLQFEEGQTVIRTGDPANLFFVVASGSVSVWLPLPGGRRRRLASIGPGLTFGEMALLDGGPRSADVVADARTICYGFSVLKLQEMTAEHPAAVIAILRNLIRNFSERLRLANRELSTQD
jgi:glutaminase